MTPFSTMPQMRHRVHLALIVAAALTIAGDSTNLHATSRAAPGVIVFTGGSLRTPVVLADWNENLRLMTAASAHASISDSALARREKIEIAMFWGGSWNRYAATPESLLAYAREAQRGAYYPAARARPAVWIFGAYGAMAASPRFLTSDGMAILRAHHLPVSAQ